MLPFYQPASWLTPKERAAVVIKPAARSSFMYPVPKTGNSNKTKELLYNAHGHKLRSPAFEKAQFVTALGIIQV